MDRLAGKVALITGAARGQGRAEAELFVAEGARVVVCDVLEDDGRAVAESLGDAAVFCALDVRSSASWQEAIDVATRRFGGGVDVLVNNAGRYVRQRIDQVTEADFRSVLDVNLVGPFLGIAAVTPLMVEAGKGSIINVSSLNGIGASPTTASYTASKFGVRGLTKAAALDLGPLGIRVNAILPGIIRTPMIADVVDAVEPQLAAGVPVRRIGEADDIAAAALFLASDESAYMNGADIVVDGGLSASLPRLVN